MSIEFEMPEGWQDFRSTRKHKVSSKRDSRIQQHQNVKTSGVFSKHRHRQLVRRVGRKKPALQNITTELGVSEEVAKKITSIAGAFQQLQKTVPEMKEKLVEPGKSVSMQEVSDVLALTALVRFQQSGLDSNILIKVKTSKHKYAVWKSHDQWMVGSRKKIGGGYFGKVELITMLGQETFQYILKSVRFQNIASPKFARDIKHEANNLKVMEQKKKKGHYSHVGWQEKGKLFSRFKIAKGASKVTYGYLTKRYDGDCWEEFVGSKKEKQWEEGIQKLQEERTKKTTTSYKDWKALSSKKNKNKKIIFQKIMTFQIAASFYEVITGQLPYKLHPNEWAGELKTSLKKDLKGLLPSSACTILLRCLGPLAKRPTAEKAWNDLHRAIAKNPKFKDLHEHWVKQYKDATNKMYKQLK